MTTLLLSHAGTAPHLGVSSEPMVPPVGKESPGWISSSTIIFWGQSLGVLLWSSPMGIIVESLWPEQWESDATEKEVETCNNQCWDLSSQSI